jgi:hypothetical protein
MQALRSHPRSIDLELLKHENELCQILTDTSNGLHFDALQKGRGSRYVSTGMEKQCT